MHFNIFTACFLGTSAWVLSTGTCPAPPTRSSLRRPRPHRPRPQFPRQSKNTYQIRINIMKQHTFSLKGSVERGQLLGPGAPPFAPIFGCRGGGGGRPPPPPEAGPALDDRGQAAAPEGGGGGGGRGGGHRGGGRGGQEEGKGIDVGKSNSWLF